MWIEATSMRKELCDSQFQFTDHYPKELQVARTDWNSMSQTINSEDQRAMVYSIDPIGQVAHSNIFGLGPVH